MLPVRQQTLLAVEMEQHVGARGAPASYCSPARSGRAPPGGQRPDLTWEFSPLLYASERSDTMFESVQISEDEADQIIARIREMGEPKE